MLILGGNQLAAGGYNVDNSLRFDDGSSDSLTRTPSSAGNRKTFTLSLWFKRASNFESTNNILWVGNDANNRTLIQISDVDVIDLQNRSGGTVNAKLSSNAKRRDPSAWYHLVWSVDTTQATSSNRIKVYVNGVQETSFSTETYPSQNTDFFINNNQSHSIGKQNDASAGFFDGYMAEVCLIDGTALDPTSFGEFDEDSGIWKPISVSGLTFGTNGFYLPFENSAALGQDDSGNGNNFTVNNLTSIDQTTDTPTNNFATLNINNAYNSTTIAGISEGNLSIGGTASDGGSTSTIGVSSGKWYWEQKVITGANTAPVTGVLNTKGANSVKVSNTQSRTSGSGFWGFYNAASGTRGIMEDGVASGNFIDSVYANNDIAMFAIDVDAQKIWYGKNGTWFGSGDPATGANASSDNLTANDTWFPYRENRSGYTTKFNFGNPIYTISSGNSDANGYGNFEYAVPSGYYALNTKNLAEYG